MADFNTSSANSSANLPPSHPCQYCGASTTYWCSRCHSVWYCCVEHMQHDWPGHRMFCRPYRQSPAVPTSAAGSANFNQHAAYSYQTASHQGSTSPTSQSPASPGPHGTLPAASVLGSPASGSTIPSSASVSAPMYHNPNAAATSNTPTASFNALLFPANEESPRLVRIQCMARAQSTGPTIWTPLPQEYLGEPQGGISSMIITNGIGGAPLRFPLHVFYGSQSFSDGSPVNRVIYRMTSGKATYPWSGNMLVLKFSGTRRQGYTEATFNDVAPLIASFLANA